MKKNWIAIAAMAENRVIGKGNALPWHIPGEMAWFHTATSGGTLIMGRKTFESLPALRSENKYIVVTRSKDYGHDGANVMVVHSVADVPNSNGGLPVWICGGEEIYRQTLPFCSEIWLTTVGGEYEGDAHFPAFEDDFTLAEVMMECGDFVVRRWIKA